MSDRNGYQSVHDLPQLHERPSSQTLIGALQGLTISQPSWDISTPNNASSSSSSSSSSPPPPSPSSQHAAHLHKNQRTTESRYLTSIISSSLNWMSDESAREHIWELASLRLCERAGRTALPQLTRTFKIAAENNNPTLTITLHEPSLTADHLGLKTWAASYLLAKRLQDLPLPLPDEGRRRSVRVLELGAGTGLLGIAAASVWGCKVHLTDLKDIVPNLERNVRANSEVIGRNGGEATTGVLDWEDREEPVGQEKRYDLVLAADPLYSPRHPRLLVDTVSRWLKRESDTARVVVELPLRDAYMKEVNEFRSRMMDEGFVIQDQGEEVGLDDWEDGGGGLAGDEIEEGRRQVRCWWAVWGK
ncbi:MAG: hypothetical protein M1816_006692 [Peltula sp. TS41687]|nr:MAG: hypothetical protein M1816_006692 [Peltula sp. TS41687]